MVFTFLNCCKASKQTNNSNKEEDDYAAEVIRGPHSLKELLSGPLQEKFAHPSFQPSAVFPKKKKKEKNEEAFMHLCGQIFDIFC